MGHLAMGLLWAAPAWFIWRGRASLVFIGIAVVAAPLPDMDLWVDKVVPSMIHHHGFMHTILFVALISVAVGAVVAATLTRPIDRWLESERFTSGSLFVFATVAFLTGGLSHLFADILSAPDIAQPIEPFWPLIDKPLIVDLIWYNNPFWNVGLLIVAVVLHLGLASVFDPFEHRFRITDD